MKTEKTEIKHTPLPWKGSHITKDVHCRDLKIIYSASYEDGENSEPARVYGDTTKQLEANAEFILRACNSHYELLEAFEQMLAYIEMRLAHNGALSVNQIMENLAKVQREYGSTETCHHLGCSKTTRRVDLVKVRAAIAKATGKDSQ